MGKKKKKQQKAETGHAAEAHPTHLAGVPLPAELREIAALANQFVKHPVVSHVISAGVLAAIAALAENESVRRAARSAGDDAENAAEGAAHQASRAKIAIKAAAGAMGKRLLDEVKDVAGAKNRGKGGKSAKAANGRETAPAH